MMLSFSHQCLSSLVETHLCDTLYYSSVQYDILSLRLWCMQIYSEYLGDVAKYKGISQSAA